MTWFSGFEEIVRLQQSLAPLTWFGLGGPAEYFAEPRTQDELAALVKRCRDEEISVRLLGGGSNLLIPDEGVSGLAIHLSAPALANE